MRGAARGRSVSPRVLAVDPGPRRRLAIVALLLMVVVAAASLEIAGYLHGRPTCEAIRSASSALTADRKCFDGSSGRQTLVEVLAVAAALLAVIGGIASWRFLERGGDERQTIVAVSLALIAAGATLLLGSI